MASIIHVLQEVDFVRKERALPISKHVPEYTPSAFSTGLK